MLLLTASSSVARRIQGAWVGEDEVRKVVAHWRRQSEPRYVEGVEGREEGPGGSASGAGDDDDDLLEQARSWSCAPSSDRPRCCSANCGSVSPGPAGSWTSSSRAAWSGPSEGSKARAVLMTVEELDGSLPAAPRVSAGRRAGTGYRRLRLASMRARVPRAPRPISVPASTPWPIALRCYVEVSVEPAPAPRGADHRARVGATGRRHPPGRPGGHLGSRPRPPARRGPLGHPRGARPRVLCGAGRGGCCRGRERPNLSPTGSRSTGIRRTPLPRHSVAWSSPARRRPAGLASSATRSRTTFRGRGARSSAGHRGGPGGPAEHGSPRRRGLQPGADGAPARRSGGPHACWYPRPVTTACTRTPEVRAVPRSPRPARRTTAGPAP